MSLIVDYGGGTSPPTADILYTSDISRLSSSTEEELSPPHSTLTSSSGDTSPHLHIPATQQPVNHPFSPPPSSLNFSPPPPHVDHLPHHDMGAPGPYCSDPQYPPGGDWISSNTRIAGKAMRRRKRSPPAASKFDINDNSLHSVYAFFRSFLR